MDRDHELQTEGPLIAYTEIQDWHLHAQKIFGVGKCQLVQLLLNTKPKQQSLYPMYIHTAEL